MKKQKIKFLRKRRLDGRKMFPVLCLLPWIIGFLVFTLYPIIQSLLYSFGKTKFRPDGSVSIKFVGLENYIEVILNDAQFKLLICNKSFLWYRLL